MNAPARLVAFLVGLIVLFGTSYVVAGAVVPDRVVEDWTRSTQEPADHSEPSTSAAPSHADGDEPHRDATHQDSTHQDSGRQEEGS